MSREIELAVKECIRAAEKLKEEKAIVFMEEVAKKIACCFENGGKILIAGNGGSLCDAMHFAEELTGQFRKPRKALPALALSEPGHLTCVSNDFGFEWVFARGVEAFGKKEDLFIGLTTSGNSENIIHAYEAAKKRGIESILFLGKDGGKLRDVDAIKWIVDGFETSDRIQEAHMAAIHVIIQRVESYLFYESKKESKEKLPV